jgi:hypothetical protein
MNGNQTFILDSHQPSFAVHPHSILSKTCLTPSISSMLSGTCLESLIQSVIDAGGLSTVTIIGQFRKSGGLKSPQPFR